MTKFTTEFFNLERLPGQPIIVHTILKSGFSVEDAIIALRYVGEILDCYGPSYLITTVKDTQIKFSLLDVVTAARAMQRGGPGSASDKRVIEVAFVNHSGWTRLARDMIGTLPAPFGRHVPVFETYEEAYEYICKRIALTKSLQER